MPPWWHHASGYTFHMKDLIKHTAATFAFSRALVERRGLRAPGPAIFNCPASDAHYRTHTQPLGQDSNSPSCKTQSPSSHPPQVAESCPRLGHEHLRLQERLSHKHPLSSACGAHHTHEDGVEEQRHGAEGLDGGHHVPLQAEREHDAQGHCAEQEHAEAVGHLERNQQNPVGLRPELTRYQGSACQWHQDRSCCRLESTLRP